MLAIPRLSKSVPRTLRVASKGSILTPRQIVTELAQRRLLKECDWVGDPAASVSRCMERHGVCEIPGFAACLGQPITTVPEGHDYFTCFSQEDGHEEFVIGPGITLLHRMCPKTARLLMSAISRMHVAGVWNFDDYLHQFHMIYWWGESSLEDARLCMGGEEVEPGDILDLPDIFGDTPKWAMEFRRLPRRPSLPAYLPAEVRQAVRDIAAIPQWNPHDLNDDDYQTPMYLMVRWSEDDSLPRMWDDMYQGGCEVGFYEDVFLQTGPASALPAMLRRTAAYARALAGVLTILRFLSLPDLGLPRSVTSRIHHCPRQGKPLIQVFA